MRTLDEVIEAFDNFVGYTVNTPDDPNRWALHYLKEYRWQLTDPDGDHQQLEKAQKLLQDFYSNKPLTWDELKEMKDHPVWIVESNIVFNDECDIERKGHWDIIKKVYPEQITFYVQGMSNHKSWQGIGWQAFRKEI